MIITKIQLKHNRGIRVISDINTALNYVRGYQLRYKNRNITYKTTKTRKCDKCGDVFIVYEMQQNKNGDSYSLCKKCFKKMCKENAAKRVKSECIIDYTPKKTIEPCVFCKSVKDSNKYYKYYNFAACDECYANLNRVCGHVKTAAIA